MTSIGFIIYMRLEDIEHGHGFMLSRLNETSKPASKVCARQGKITMARNPKSPYQKYGKAPFVYSIAYREWKSAAIKFGAGSEQAQRWAVEHATAMGIKRLAMPAPEAFDIFEGVDLV